MVVSTHFVRGGNLVKRQVEKHSEQDLDQQSL